MRRLSRFVVAVAGPVSLTWTAYGFIPHLASQRLSTPPRLEKSTRLQLSQGGPFFASPQERIVRDTSISPSTRQGELQSLIDQADDLRWMIERSAESNEEESSQVTSSLESLESQVAELERQIKTLLKQLVPPAGLSQEAYELACLVVLQLPLVSRVALCNAMGEEDAVATNVNEIPRLVARLYTDPPAEPFLRQTFEMAKSKSKMGTLAIAPSVGTLGGIYSSATKNSSKEQTKDTENNNANGFDSIFSTGSEERSESSATVDQLLPRVTRKQDRVATQRDLDKVVARMPRDYFVVASTEPIDGGFVIRGSFRKEDTQLCLEQIQKVVLPDDLQLCLTEDFLDVEQAAMGSAAASVLLLFKKDMSPTTSSIFTASSSLSALGSALLFSLGVYGSNDDVMSQLATIQLDDKVLDILVPLFTIQLLVFLGQFAVSKANGLKTTAPTALPFWTMPFMGTYMQLKESPRNLNELIDFAMIGPLLGITTSMICLVTGLQLTAAASADAAQYFPALPVSVLQYSTLGGSVVDSLLGGTNGFYTLQDPTTAVSLHPLAVAGFSGLLISCLDLLPLGSTSGGRMSLSLLGRQGHSIVGGLTWFVLLLCSFIGEGADVLVAAWVVNNIVQNDPEIPCQNEIEAVTVTRVIAALTLWAASFLVLTPMV